MQGLETWLSWYRVIARYTLNPRFNPWHYYLYSGHSNRKVRRSKSGLGVGGDSVSISFVRKKAYTHVQINE